MGFCSVEDCSEASVAKGFCRNHYMKFRYYGYTEIPPQRYREYGTGCIDQQGYKRFGSISEHIILAEKALGRALPVGAQVHHVNRDRSDNLTPWNLVICPDRGYHSLLEVRTRALEACGNPNARKCHHCGEWESPESGDMYVGSSVYHRSCRRLYLENLRRVR